MRKSYFARHWFKMLLTALILIGLLVLVFFGGDWFLRKKLPCDYAEFVEAAAAETGLDKFLIYAVISTESDFRPEAVSSAGAVGLMQVTPSTGEWLGKKYDLPFDDLTDPATNIALGSHLLLYLKKQYDGDLTLMLAAYNAGVGNVKKWLADPAYSSDGLTLSRIPFRETSQYIKKVTTRYELYCELY